MTHRLSLQFSLMRVKNVHFILNPGAGAEEPILSHINKVFCDNNIKWAISITQKKNDAFNFAKQLIGKTDVVAVYGGDGSLAEVARALCGTDTPMAIIAGGTANIMAKELGVSLDALESLELLKSGRLKVIKMDIGSVNNHPFILRVNLGIMADMIINTDSKLKAKIGQLAYGITAIDSIVNAQSVNYHLSIDGKKINEKGVTLTVTNVGSLGIGNFELLPGISVTDGFLDVILMKDTGILDMFKIAGSTLFQTDSDVLMRWRCREITINMDKSTSFICDDFEKKAKRLRIKILPAALKVVVPANLN